MAGRLLLNLLAGGRLRVAGRSTKYQYNCSQRGERDSAHRSRLRRVFPVVVGTAYRARRENFGIRTISY